MFEPTVYSSVAYTLFTAVTILVTSYIKSQLNKTLYEKL